MLTQAQNLYLHHTWPRSPWHQPPPSPMYRHACIMLFVLATLTAFRWVGPHELNHPSGQRGMRIHRRGRAVPCGRSLSSFFFFWSNGPTSGFRSTPNTIQKWHEEVLVVSYQETAIARNLAEAVPPLEECGVLDDDAIVQNEAPIPTTLHHCWNWDTKASLSLLNIKEGGVVDHNLVDEDEA